jgi:gephyrin
MADLASAIPMSEAIAIALAHTEALAPTAMRFDEALGHMLAADVFAAEPHPPFRASIKDGFAVRAADAADAGGATLEVVGESRAGTRESVRVGPGQACYVTTGGPIPDGADAVVEVERTAAVNDGAESLRRRIRILNSPRVGQDIRPIGFDIGAGTRVLAAGDLIGAPEIGLLATVGATLVSVRPKPSVAIVSTGDEVVDATAAEAAAEAQAGSGPSALPRNCIRDAVRPMLLAAIREERLASSSIDLGVCADDATALRAAIERALHADADVLITSGGVSAGDRDLLGAHVLAEYGRVLYSLVKMKPGKPLTFTVIERAGRLGRGRAAAGGRGGVADGGRDGADGAAREGSRPLLVFSLPGNPVSAYATFQLVVAPVLRKLGGAAEPGSRRLPVELADAIQLDAERPEYHRATLEAAAADDAGGLLRARSTGGQISSRLLSCRQAEVLLVLPQGPGLLPAGARIDALVLRDLRAHLAPTVAVMAAARRQVRVTLVPHGAAADEARIDACARAVARALRESGLSADASVVDARSALQLAPLFTPGEQRLVLVVHSPTVPLADAGADVARAAVELGARLARAPALAAAVRRAVAADDTGLGAGAQDAAIVDGQSILLVVGADEVEVERCARTVAHVLDALLAPKQKE